jgi:hypothetical protein
MCILLPFFSLLFFPFTSLSFFVVTAQSSPVPSSLVSPTFSPKSTTLTAASPLHRPLSLQGTTPGSPNEEDDPDVTWDDVLDSEPDSDEDTAPLRFRTMRLDRGASDDDEETKTPRSTQNFHFQTSNSENSTNLENLSPIEEAEKDEKEEKHSLPPTRARSVVVPPPLPIDFPQPQTRPPALSTASQIAEAQDTLSEMPELPASAVVPSSPTAQVLASPRRRSSTFKHHRLNSGGSFASVRRLSSARRLSRVSSSSGLPPDASGNHKEYSLLEKPPPLWYAYEDLVEAEDVAPWVFLRKKEIYLADEEFEQTFGVGKLGFDALEPAVQMQLKRRVMLL